MKTELVVLEAREMTKPDSAKSGPGEPPGHGETHAWGTGDSPPKPTIDPDRHLVSLTGGLLFS